MMQQQEEDGEGEDTEGEQYEDANDYVHPSNVVLEESNEDGTISVGEYGQGGASQSMIQQQTQMQNEVSESYAQEEEEEYGFEDQFHHHHNNFQ